MGRSEATQCFQYTRGLKILSMSRRLLRPSKWWSHDRFQRAYHRGVVADVKDDDCVLRIEPLVQYK